MRFAIVELEKLRPHEQTQPALLAKIADALVADGCVIRALLVESRHMVILDGHHRFEALRRIGCRRAPVYLVEYESDAIDLTTWPEAPVRKVSKEEVVDRGVRGDLFPPKTTRHLVSFELEDVRIPLDKLR
ncbi:MAG TPA: ParB N-terminal domain-containing protein [Thermoplasmata archaeon]|nr:ParB N-terminal domain-containing protein [Thermoplasmata archaeon]